MALRIARLPTEILERIVFFVAEDGSLSRIIQALDLAQSMHFHYVIKDILGSYNDLPTYFGNLRLPSDQDSLIGRPLSTVTSQLAKQCRLDLLRCIVQCNFKFQLVASDVQRAVDQCRLDMLDFVLENGLAQENSHGCRMNVESAVAHGRVDVLEWLNKKGPPFFYANLNPTLVTIAAQHGRLNVLEYLIDTILVWKKTGTLNLINKRGTSPMDVAAAAGHLHVIEFLYSQGLISITQVGIGSAKASGHENVCQWLESHLSLDLLARYTMTQRGGPALAYDYIC